MVEIHLVINKCSECRHRDHSGAFTEGGAKGVCSHDEAVETMVSTEVEDRWHWKHRVIDWNKEPPEKCPLRKGYSY